MIRRCLLFCLLGKKVQWSQSKSQRVPANSNPGVEVNVFFYVCFSNSWKILYC